MIVVSSEQDPFFNAVETETGEHEVLDSGTPQTGGSEQNQDNFGIYFELEMLDHLRDLPDIDEEVRKDVLQSYRERILDYAESSASVEEKGAIVRKFLESLGSPHGFHNPEDLIAARQVISYGVDWPVIDEFKRYIDHYKDVNPGLELWLYRLMVTTDPEEIRKIVYTDFGPVHNWHT